MFLNADELYALTGSRQKRKQIQWLTEHGWPHVVNARKRPVVLASTVEARLGLVTRSQPNFGAINGSR